VSTKRDDVHPSGCICPRCHPRVLGPTDHDIGVGIGITISMVAVLIVAAIYWAENVNERVTKLEGK
jgi:hypothetical protein